MNYTEDQIVELESSIEHWMLGNLEDAKENLGEGIVYAVQEVLDHE